MAVANRELDRTEQMRSLSSLVSLSVGASAGSSFHTVQVPYPCTLMAYSVAANGVSGAPVASLDVKRWSGAGVTTVLNLGQSLTIVAHGISAAYQSMSLAAAGSTLLSLQAGDVLVLNMNFSGGNVAASNTVVTAVVQATQDFKQMYGLPA